MKQKFKSLTHEGPIFPPEYEPKGYEAFGEKLSPLAEEQFVKWAALRETDYVKDAEFNKNFFSCLKLQLTENQKSHKFPEDWKQLTDKVYDDLQIAKEEKKIYNKEHKDEIKAEKEALKEKYGVAYIDNKPQPLGGFLIEPPGIFMARGKSPLRGLWKYRTVPEDVIINYVSNDNNCPKAPQGHNWKRVDKNTNLFATATYKVNIGDKTTRDKKIQFGAVSDVKQDADRHKFEKAKKLIKNWDKMEAHINEGMKSSDPVRKQSALVSWLILQTGIRIGMEQDPEISACTVGASTLLCKNMKIE